MSHTLTTDQVKHIARLARIALSDQEVEQYASQLSQVIDYNVAQLAKLNLESVEPTNQTSGLINIWQSDVVVDSLNQEAALSQSARVIDHQFQVAKVLGES